MQAMLTLSEATYIVRQLTHGNQATSTVWRWTTGRHHGGSKLKTVWFGEVAYTTSQWIAEFLKEKDRRKNWLDPEPLPEEPEPLSSAALITLAEAVRYVSNKRNRIVGRSTVWRWAFANRRSGLPLRIVRRGRGREILTSRRWIDDYLRQAEHRRYRV